MDNKETMRAEAIEYIKQLKLIDDEMMIKCLAENKDCAELVVNTIVGREDLRIEEMDTSFEVVDAQDKFVAVNMDAVDQAG